MKNSLKVFTCMLAIAACGTMTAQAQSSPKIGLKGGVNLTNLYVDNVEDEHMKVGANIGLYTKIPVTSLFAIQPEIAYSMKGTQTNYNNVFGSGKYKFNLDYLEIPVAAVVNVSNNFSLHAGPYVGFLLSAKVKDVDQNGNIKGVTELNKDNFQSTDYGLFGGLGYEVGGVSLGARYTYGLQTVGKSGLASDLTQNSKNVALTFYLGIGL
jgi:hypothetical protein